MPQVSPQLCTRRCAEGLPGAGGCGGRRGTLLPIHKGPGVRSFSVPNQKTSRCRRAMKLNSFAGRAVVFLCNFVTTQLGWRPWLFGWTFNSMFNPDLAGRWAESRCVCHFLGVYDSESWIRGNPFGFSFRRSVMFSMSIPNFRRFHWNF